MRRLSLFIFSALLAGLLSCTSDPNADVADIELDLDFVRVDSLLFLASSDLVRTEEPDFFGVYQAYLRQEKDFLFFLSGLDLVEDEKGPIPVALVDTLIALRMGPFLADSMTFQLLDTLQKMFPPGYPFKSRISPVIKRYHKYFPEVTLPAFRTHINGYGPTAPSVDQVMITSRYFSFGLHYFAGPDFPFYSPELPRYIRRRLSPEYLEVILAQELAQGTVWPVPPDSRPSLLDKMIREGIRLYFVDQLLPQTPDSMKIFYTSEQMEWAMYFEADIYKELTPQFFEMDFMSHREYLSEKPFTTGLSGESAPRLGEFLGWRIVKSYMDQHSEVSLLDLAQEQDYQKIFRESRYKP